MHEGKAQNRERTARCRAHRQQELRTSGRAMIRTALDVAVGVTVSIYLIGVAWEAYRAVRVAPAWLREHPGSLGGAVRRPMTVAGLVLAWPLALLALAGVLWWERHRCPFGECALFGWRTPGTTTRAPISVYRCPHHPPRLPAPGRRPCPANRGGQEDDESHDDDDALVSSWYPTFLGMIAASGVGALAGIPIPYPGYLVVSGVVAFASVEPLEVIFRELLARTEARSHRC